MSNVTVTAADFLATFPEFEGTSIPLIDSFITQAEAYISTENYGILQNKSRVLAIELMTAHLMTINDRIVKDKQSQAVFVASANIHDVSVSLVPPTNANQYEFWLNLTVYGTRLWALLSTKTPCGFYVAGSPQRVLI